MLGVIMFSKSFNPDKEKDQIVWGIRVQTIVKRNWMLLARVINVPVSRLVAFVLQDWMEKNGALLKEKEGRYRLSQMIFRKDKSISHKAPSKITNQPSDERDEENDGESDEENDEPSQPV